MEQRRVEKTNQGAEELADAVKESYRAAVESTTAAMQESNVRLAQNFFESGVEALKVQAEINQHVLQSLSEQFRKNQEVFNELSRESLGAYENFLNSLFALYQGTPKATNDAAQKETTLSERRSREVVQLLEEWLADESGYDEETWPELKATLNRNRSSERKLFVD